MTSVLSSPAGAGDKAVRKPTRKATAKKKIVRTAGSVAGFIDALTPEAKRRDSRQLAQIMRRASGRSAMLWGNGIVGFGRYRYQTSAGRENEAPMIAFSPRGAKLSLYHMDLEASALLRRLGRYQTGQRCLYLARLSDVDVSVLEALCAHSFRRVRKAHGG